MRPAGWDVLDLDGDPTPGDPWDDMRTAFVSAGQPLWTRATVTVDSAGTAKANFTYAD